MVMYPNKVTCFHESFILLILVVESACVGTVSIFGSSRPGSLAARLKIGDGQKNSEKKILNPQQGPKSGEMLGSKAIR